MARGGSKSTNVKPKRKPAKQSPRTHDEISSSQFALPLFVPLGLQQQCLDIFRTALSPSEADHALLQEVKGHLYRRDFAAAFGTEDALRVYASRWSPSRALAYTEIFAGLEEELSRARVKRVREDERETAAFRVVCLGGGAGGELVAWACTAAILADVEARMAVELVDIADWKSVVDRLSHSATTPLKLSKYASQAKRDAARELCSPERLSVGFRQLDVLLEAQKVLLDNTDDARSSNVDMVTLMFTLNELYSTSLSATQELLNILTQQLETNALLLVVDSPGSYSMVSVNGAERKYPMLWLLDHSLLGSPAQANPPEGAQWEKVMSEESRWFRLQKELRYTIPLEDMRYQMHLYRHL